MYDLYLLHSHKQGHVQKEMEDHYDSEIRNINLKISELTLQYTSNVNNSALASDIRFSLKSAKKEKTELLKKRKENHIANYLLQSMPMVQRYSRLEHCNRKEDKSERLSILDTYVKTFYNKDYEQFKKHNTNQDIKKNTHRHTQTTSKCCNAYIIQMSDSSRVCTSCGVVVEKTAEIGQNPMMNISYTRNITPVKIYSYRRLNHLRELVRQITGKTQQNLNKDQLEIIKSEIKRNYVDYHDVTPRYIRKTLKHLGLNKYYDQTISITKCLNPEYKAPKISDEYEEKLVVQFCMLETPFEKIRSMVDKTRKNFLSYRYTFYRLNQLNRRMDLNDGIHLLKSVKLLNKQDKFWKLLMNELNWPYLGSMSTRDSKDLNHKSQQNQGL